ncbi:hypothetical protein KCU62_g128, partial [Aureobasidium sp. EXF-3399]
MQKAFDNHTLDQEDIWLLESNISKNVDQDVLDVEQLLGLYSLPLLIPHHQLALAIFHLSVKLGVTYPSSLPTKLEEYLQVRIKDLGLNVEPIRDWELESEEEQQRRAFRQASIVNGETGYARSDSTFRTTSGAIVGMHEAKGN